MPMTVQEGTPVPVRITQDDTRNIPAKTVPREVAGTQNSYILTTLPIQILAHAPKRRKGTIIVNANTNSVIAIGGSYSDCQAAVTAGIGQFIGEVAYINGVYSSPIDLGTTDEVWAALVAGGQVAQEQIGANPAAGAVFNYVNNTGAAQTLQSISWTLVTSAAVANRFIGVRILDVNNNIVASQANLTAVVASSTINSFYSQGLSNIPNSAAGTSIGGLPNVVIQPGWTVRLFVSAEDAGDQLSNIIMTFGTDSPVVLSVFKEVNI